MHGSLSMPAIIGAALFLEWDQKKIIATNHEAGL